MNTSIPGWSPEPRRWPLLQKSLESPEWENVVEVQKMFSANPHISEQMFSLLIGISFGSVETIIHKHLYLRKTCAKCVTHKLTDSKKSRVDIWKILITIFLLNGPKRLTDICTCGESWFILSKFKTMVWVGENDLRPQVLKPDFRSRKSLFSICFNYKGADYMSEGMMMTGTYHVNILLNTLVRKIQEKRLCMAATKTLLLRHNALSHKLEE